MPRAYCLIRGHPVYRVDSFVEGLQHAGYSVTREYHGVVHGDDVLVIWNRYGQYNHIARLFELKGAKVLIAENGYLGRDWREQHWYALARNAHNGAGTWHVGDASRWDSLGVELAPWRHGGAEVVVLATRHIGIDSIAEPRGWAERTAETLARTYRVAVRVRAHPGEGACVPLAQDLSRAMCVVSWGSGAALKAILWGVPAFYGFDRWIGAGAAAPLADFPDRPFMGDRLPMLRRLAWAQWTTEEIASGEPFKCLL